MFRWPKSLFVSRSQKCANDVMRRRSEALAKVKDAESRGDTRDYGRALMVLKQATHDELRAGATQ